MNNPNLKNPQKAEFHLNKALELDENVENADAAHFYLGLIYFQEPDFINMDKAREHLEMALELNEDAENAENAEKARSLLEQIEKIEHKNE